MRARVVEGDGRMQVRVAVETDLTALLRLYRHLNQDDAPAEPARAQAAFAAMLRSPLVKVFVAEVEEGLASSCTLVVVPNLTRGARPYAVIENVVTDAAFRRRGLGQAVLAAALARAWAEDCYKVMLATGSKREETLRFYERAGFERGGKTFFQARRSATHGG